MLVVIVPAFNEEKNIGSVVRSLFNQPVVNQVVVVDDCSEDQTAKIAKEAGAIVLKHTLNCGQGAALQTGQEYAKMVGADYVAHFDADGQFVATDLAEALQEIVSKKVNILFGSRFLGKKSNLPWLKHYLILPLGRLVNFFVGAIKLTDPQNGFRILDKQALSLIQIEQPRMAHATEIMVKVKKNDLSYTEFPVTVVYHHYGQSLKGGWQIIKDLFLGKFIN